MNRKALILVASGALVAAVIGTAIGANAGEVSSRRDDPPAATATPSDDITPEDTSTPGDAGTPSDDPSFATPSDDPTTGTTHAPTAAPTRDRSTGATGTGTISRQRAVDIALARTGGQLVKVETEEEHGRSIWSVRISKDGARIRIDVDARTGQIVRSERDAEDGSHGGGRSGDDDRHGDDDNGGDRHGRGSDH